MDRSDPLPTSIARRLRRAVLFSGPTGIVAEWTGKPPIMKTMKVRKDDTWKWIMVFLLSGCLVFFSIQAYQSMKVHMEVFLPPEDYKEGDSYDLEQKIMQRHHPATATQAATVPPAPTTPTTPAGDMPDIIETPDTVFPGLATTGTAAIQPSDGSTTTASAAASFVPPAPSAP